MIKYALAYAEKGWPVFPVHTMRAGKCSCGDGNCQHPAKHPMTTKGFKDATTDAEQIRSWWTQWPDANIGYAPPAGVVVLDVDINHDLGKYGDETLSNWTEEQGAMPETVLCLTGGGGLQYYLTTPKRVSNRTNLLPSIDVRTQGGYVILPPSMHKSGRRYEWEASSDPEDTPMAVIPDPLLALMSTQRGASKEIPDKIPNGQRNDILFKMACSLRGKGLTEMEIMAAVSRANQDRCTPPLTDREIKTLVHSASRYERGELHKQGGTPTSGDGHSVRPTDFTDTANSRIFAREYRDKAIYTKATGWLIWNGHKWEENDLEAAGLAMSLTDQMLAEARAEMQEAGDAMTAAKVAEDDDAKGEAQAMEAKAKAYMKHAKASRAKNKITAMLVLAQTHLQVNPDRLDADPYALNTPAGIVDLRTGVLSPHDPPKLCTKITKFGPGTKGASRWAEHLDMIGCSDEKLISFLQQISGMAAIGSVFEENLAIAIGDGKNGKSAHFNSQAIVMGDYAGTLSADVLTTANRSRGAELATLKGKRLVIAAETDEGARLSTSMLKQLTSTDKIHAERKYRDPEDFTPSHTAVLYTNHFPRVGSTDTGTWRRIVPIPFDARIPADREVKNYAEVLAREAGEAIMTWIVEGAVNFYRTGHRLVKPEVVELLLEEYQERNDWMGEFLEEFCEIGQGRSVGAQALYSTYHDWAREAHGYVRRKDAFGAELEKRGFGKLPRDRRGIFWGGLSLRLTGVSYSHFDRSV